MTCHTNRPTPRLTIVLVSCLLGAAELTAQSPPPTPPTPPAPQPQAAPPVPPLSAYRAPALALVQPPPGALTIPQDRPVVVFRFAQGEAADPIDVSSFRVTVDGRDRTTLFQLSAGEAWGPLSEAGAAAPLAAGPHQVAARVCSSRGACGELAVTLTAVAPTTAARDDTADASSRRWRVFDLLLSAMRWLFGR